MLINSEPLDTLFFRNGKPFTKGEDYWSESIFPPYPSVFYGALRTAYFAEKLGNFDLAGTEQDPTLSLKIRGIFLKAWNNYYFPLPLDLVKEKDNRENYVFPLQLQDAPCLSNCCVPKTLCAPDQVVETISDGLIDRETLREYLENDTDKFFYASLKDFITHEPKIGIALNEKHIADDQKLYRAAMLRLSLPWERGRENLQCSFVIDCEGIDLPECGFLKLGGEGKATRYIRVREENETSLIPSCPVLDNRLFKLYLLTPTILSNGWLPNWIDPNNLIGIYQGLKVKLLTAALGKYISIGGFDIKNGKPKPMVRAVPAGSVYYFELLEGEKERVEQIFHYKPFEDNQYAKEGFGTVLVGKVE